MALRIGINGFGRIGRLVTRAAQGKDVEIVGINDITSASTLAHLLKYDSVHGRFSGEVEAVGGGIRINGQVVPTSATRDPKDLPWSDLDVDVVMERMLEVASDLRGDVKFGSYVIDPPDMLGVDRMNDFGPVIRMMQKTHPDRMFVVKRELLRRITKRFEELGISLQDPNRIALQQPKAPGA